MGYTLIIAFRGTVADDRLLHAIACALGPAHVGGVDALDEECHLAGYTDQVFAQHPEPLVRAG